MSTLPGLPRLAPYAAPQPDGEPYSHEWSGYLTEENYRHVAAKMRELFADRELVITTCYEYRQYEPEVRAPVRLVKGAYINYDHEADGIAEYDYGDHVNVAFSDRGWSYGLGTSSWARMRTQPHWWFDAENELTKSPRRTMPDATLVEGNPRERASKVLRFLHECEAARVTPYLKFEGRTLIVHDHAPNGQEYYTTITALEGGTGHVVLESTSAAVAWNALQEQVEEGKANQDSLDVREHIERVFGGPTKVRRWLP